MQPSAGGVGLSEPVIITFIKLGIIPELSQGVGPSPLVGGVGSANVFKLNKF